MYGRRLIFGTFVLVLLTMGCAKTPAMTAASAPAPGGGTATGAVPTPAPSTPPAMEAARPAPQPAAPRPTMAPGEWMTVADVRDIYFDFDKYDIRPGDAKILDSSAGWLNKNPDQLLLIEGHCDERGTSEYNLVLGERRAKAAMNYLTTRGVAASRVTVVSFGEDRPVCTEHSEGCWAKNRRAHSLVKRK